MTPDEMSELLRQWEDGLIPTGAWMERPERRVVCLEPDGPRRTWVLWQGGRQVGLVRLRFWQGAEGQREWLYEASDRTRQFLGLDGAPEPGQTGSHG